MSAEKGLSVEIAVYRAMAQALSKNRADTQSIRFGTAAEDARKGDIVYTVHEKEVFIDAKSGPPPEYQTLAEGFDNAYTLKQAKNPAEKEEMGCDVSVVLWPGEPKKAVTDRLYAAGNFRTRIEFVLKQIQAIT